MYTTCGVAILDLAAEWAALGRAGSERGVEAVQENSYELLGARDRLAVLEALLHVAADSEALRSHIHQTNPEVHPPQDAQRHVLPLAGSGASTVQLWS